MNLKQLENITTEIEQIENLIAKDNTDMDWIKKPLKRFKRRIERVSWLIEHTKEDKDNFKLTADFIRKYEERCEPPVEIDQSCEPTISSI